MIVFFGPAGAGKSVQGQLLAARMGWRWLSAGQLLRDSKDPAIIHTMLQGGMVSHETITTVMGQAMANAGSVDRLIVDGFPRLLQQAEWLVQSQPDHGQSIALAVVIDVQRDTLLERLRIRGRADDTADAIDHRLTTYTDETVPILHYLENQGIAVVHIDGHGSVGHVHDLIMQELEVRNLV